MITSQSFTAEMYLNLPEGVTILSPAYSTPDGTPRYRMVARSEESIEAAQNKLIEAGFIICLDAQA